MPGFDITDRKHRLNRSFFIEASAGTGKTFTIIASLIRLIAEEGLHLDQILLVTFTRAASLELKTRLRKGLEQTYDAIQRGGLKADWLQSMDIQQQERAKKAIRMALFSFDEANVFTIHSFCHFILQEYALVADVNLDLGLLRSSKEKIGEIVKDFFRSQNLENILLPFQFEKVMKYCKQDFDHLLNEILYALSFRSPISGGIEISELSSIFASAPMPNLLQVLEKGARNFKGFLNPKKELKEDAHEAMTSFSALVENRDFTCDKINSILEKVELLQNFKRENLQQKAASFDDPDMAFFQKNILSPLLKAVDPLQIIATVARHIKPHVDLVIAQEECFFFEDFLKINAELSKNPAFAKELRGKYKAVLIDEFQDTDPLQWEIFSTLFCHADYQGSLIVVGDPKQAIYGFRGADIYTYLEAREVFKEENIYSLMVNYRSSPELVTALNRLLCNTPHFFQLPKKNASLPCKEVQFSDRACESLITDGRGSIHFFATESENAEAALFSFIIDESLTLAQGGAVSFNDIAILVKDRYQADRFFEFSQKHQLPVVLRRAESLVNSKAIDVLILFLEAIMNPKDISLLLQVLGGSIFRYDEEALEALKHSEEKKHEIVKQFYFYKEILEKEGILVFFHEVLKKSGIEKALLLDLLQLVEIGSTKAHFLDGYLSFYQGLKLEDPEKEEYKKRQPCAGDSIQVMTIHTSKGLEFGVVFALGLASKSVKTNSFFLSNDKKERKTSLSDEDPWYAEEIEAEKMRLFYVAATRAKRRLYLPYAMDAKDSIMHRFLEKKMQGLAFGEWIQAQEGITFSECKENVENTFIPKKVEREVSHKIMIPRSFQKVHMHSFSMLANKKEKKKSVQEKSTLPTGKEMGVLLHGIFEKLSFAEASKAKNAAQIALLVSPFIENSEFFSYLDEISKLVFYAFTTPFHLQGESFCLKDVSSDKMMREMPFLFMEEKNALCGVIDLFFEFNNKFYLLDWKSNYLGPKSEDYALPALEKEMRTQDYYLQERIYRDAVRKYLSLFHSSPFEELFGGTFYVFLRGLPKEGVIHVGNC